VNAKAETYSAAYNAPERVSGAETSIEAASSRRRPAILCPSVSRVGAVRQETHRSCSSSIMCCLRKIAPLCTRRWLFRVLFVGQRAQSGRRSSTGEMHQFILSDEFLCWCTLFECPEDAWSATRSISAHSVRSLFSSSDYERGRACTRIQAWGTRGKLPLGVEVGDSCAPSALF
jgi:hypothetical protein